MPVINGDINKQVSRWANGIATSSERQINARESLSYEATLMTRDIAYGDPVRLRPIIRAVFFVWLADFRLRRARKRHQYFRNLSNKEESK